MSRRAFTPEKIINKLREAEVLLSQGDTVGEASRKIGVTEQTYYRWRREYGGMRVEQARRLKEMEKENARLKKLVADLSLDNALAELKPPKAPHMLVEVLTDDEIPRILSCLDPEEGSLGLSESLTDASTACNIATPIRTRNSGETIGLSNLTILHWGEHYGNQKRQGKRDLGTEIQNS